MGFHPYLNFDGNCAEAFTRYHEIFGGELEVMKMSDMPPSEDVEVEPEHADLVMHAALTLGDDLLMGSDDPTGGFKGIEGAYVNHSTADVDAVGRTYRALAEGGEEIMPVGPTFWSPAFGMCRDRFGVLWMVNADTDAS